MRLRRGQQSDVADDGLQGAIQSAVTGVPPPCPSVSLVTSFGKWIAARDKNGPICHTGFKASAKHRVLGDGMTDERALAQGTNPGRDIHFLCPESALQPAMVTLSSTASCACFKILFSVDRASATPRFSPKAAPEMRWCFPSD